MASPSEGEAFCYIPYFFKPVLYRDNLYVDGGLKGNFPMIMGIVL